MACYTIEFVKMKPTNIKPGQGKILISEPSMRDYFFKKAVVLLADHNKEGSFGIILNKPLNIKVSNAIQEIPDFDAKIYLGGPVKPESLFYIHKRKDLIKDSIPIKEDLYWGGDFEDVKKQIKEKKITNKEIRFFIGYSGWAPDQLNKELQENSWFVISAQLEKLIKKNPNDLWSLLLKRMGEEYAIWSNYPTDPALN